MVEEENAFAEAAANVEAAKKQEEKRAEDLENAWKKLLNPLFVKKWSADLNTEIKRHKHIDEFIASGDIQAFNKGFKADGLKTANKVAEELDRILGRAGAGSQDGRSKSNPDVQPDTKIGDASADTTKGADQKDDPFFLKRRELDVAVGEQRKADKMFKATQHGREMLQLWLKAKRSGLDPSQYPFFANRTDDVVKFAAFADQQDALDVSLRQLERKPREMRFGKTKGVRQTEQALLRDLLDDLTQQQRDSVEVFAKKEGYPGFIKAQSKDDWIKNRQAIETSVAEIVRDMQAWQKMEDGDAKDAAREAFKKKAEALTTTPEVLLDVVHDDLLEKEVEKGIVQGEFEAKWKADKDAREAQKEADRLEHQRVADEFFQRIEQAGTLDEVWDLISEAAKVMVPPAYSAKGTADFSARVQPIVEAKQQEAAEAKKVEQQQTISTFTERIEAAGTSAEAEAIRQEALQTVREPEFEGDDVRAFAQLVESIVEAKEQAEAEEAQRQADVAAAATSASKRTYHLPSKALEDSVGMRRSAREALIDASIQKVDAFRETERAATIAVLENLAPSSSGIWKKAKKGDLTREQQLIAAINEYKVTGVITIPDGVVKKKKQQELFKDLFTRAMAPYMEAKRAVVEAVTGSATIDSTPVDAAVDASMAAVAQTAEHEAAGFYQPLVERWDALSNALALADTDEERAEINQRFIDLAGEIEPLLEAFPDLESDQALVKEIQALAEKGRSVASATVDNLIAQGAAMPDTSPGVDMTPTPGGAVPLPTMEKAGLRSMAEEEAEEDRWLEELREVEQRIAAEIGDPGQWGAFTTPLEVLLLAADSESMPDEDLRAQGSNDPQALRLLGNDLEDLSAQREELRQQLDERGYSSSMSVLQRRWSATSAEIDPKSGEYRAAEMAFRDQIEALAGDPTIWKNSVSMDERRRVIGELLADPRANDRMTAQLVMMVQNSRDGLLGERVQALRGLQKNLEARRDQLISPDEHTEAGILPAADRNRPVENTLTSAEAQRWTERQNALLLLEERIANLPDARFNAFDSMDRRLIVDQYRRQLAGDQPDVAYLQAAFRVDRLEDCFSDFPAFVEQYKDTLAPLYDQIDVLDRPAPAPRRFVYAENAQPVGDQKRPAGIFARLRNWLRPEADRKTIPSAPTPELGATYGRRPMKSRLAGTEVPARDLEKLLEVTAQRTDIWDTKKLKQPDRFIYFQELVDGLMTVEQLKKRRLLVPGGEVYLQQAVAEGKAFAAAMQKQPEVVSPVPVEEEPKPETPESVAFGKLETAYDQAVDDFNAAVQAGDDAVANRQRVLIVGLANQMSQQLLHSPTLRETLGPEKEAWVAEQMHQTAHIKIKPKVTGGNINKSMERRFEDPSAKAGEPVEVEVETEVKDAGTDKKADAPAYEGSFSDLVRDTMGEEAGKEAAALTTESKGFIADLYESIERRFSSPIDRLSVWNDQRLINRVEGKIKDLDKQKEKKALEVDATKVGAARVRKNVENLKEEYAKINVTLGLEGAAAHGISAADQAGFDKQIKDFEEAGERLQEEWNALEGKRGNLLQQKEDFERRANEARDRMVARLEEKKAANEQALKILKEQQRKVAESKEKNQDRLDAVDGHLNGLEQRLKAFKEAKMGGVKTIKTSMDQLAAHKKELEGKVAQEKSVIARLNQEVATLTDSNTALDKQSDEIKRGKAAEPAAVPKPEVAPRPNRISRDAENRWVIDLGAQEKLVIDPDTNQRNYVDKDGNETKVDLSTVTADQMKDWGMRPDIAANLGFSNDQVDALVKSQQDDVDEEEQKSGAVERGKSRVKSMVEKWNDSVGKDSPEYITDQVLRKGYERVSGDLSGRDSQTDFFESLLADKVGGGKKQAVGKSLMKKFLKFLLG